MTDPKEKAARPGRVKAAYKTPHSDDTQKPRIVMVCPCCGGEVTHQRYGFDVLMQSPFRYVKWFVCDDCEAALSGTDDAARSRTEAAMSAYVEGLIDAPAP